MKTEYYSSVNEWLEAGSPLDKPFLIVREETIRAGDFNETYVLSLLNGLATLIIHNLARYCNELGGSGYHIEPAPSMFNARTFDYEGETFGVAIELPIIRATRASARLSVGAIATILSCEYVPIHCQSQDYATLDRRHDE